MSSIAIKDREKFPGMNSRKSNPKSTICPNDKTQMVPKNTNIVHHRLKSKIKDYFVCAKCGFEKRLA